MKTTNEPIHPVTFAQMVHNGRALIARDKAIHFPATLSISGEVQEIKLAFGKCEDYAFRIDGYTYAYPRDIPTKTAPMAAYRKGFAVGYYDQRVAGGGRSLENPYHAKASTNFNRRLRSDWQAGFEAGVAERTDADRIENRRLVLEALKTAKRLCPECSSPMTGTATKQAGVWFSTLLCSTPEKHTQGFKDAHSPAAIERAAHSEDLARDNQKSFAKHSTGELSPSANAILYNAEKAILEIGDGVEKLDRLLSEGEADFPIESYERGRMRESLRAIRAELRKLHDNAGV